jgi:hypothetical protein
MNVSVPFSMGTVMHPTDRVLNGVNLAVSVPFPIRNRLASAEAMARAVQELMT